MLKRLLQFYKNKLKSLRAKKLPRGYLVFPHTGDVATAQRILEEAGMHVEVQGPPPALRANCEAVIEFPLVLTLQVKNLLRQKNMAHLDVVTMNKQALEPVSLYQITHFDQWLMVRAASMKLTIDKNTRIIVNVSGGGCPDAPYLAELLTGKKIEDAPAPHELGQTLCGYALHLAFMEMKRLCRG